MIWNEKKSLGLGTEKLLIRFCLFELTMKKEVVEVKGAAKPVSPYSLAIRVGQFVYVSGQVSMDLQTGKLLPDDIVGQTKRTLENLKTVLESANSSLENVVKTTVFLRDFKDYSQMNEVYSQYFAVPPARATVQVAALIGNLDVEIEAVALIKE